MALYGATLVDMRTAVKEWSQRKNISDATLTDFINIALIRAVRNLRIPPMEKVVSIAIDNDGYFLIPTDFIEAKEVVLVRNNENIILQRKAIHEIDYIYNQSPGTPCYFGRLRENFRVAPYDNPAADPDNVSLYYFAMFAPLTNDADCNWLLSNAPDLILYGTLAELAAYTRDEESEMRWNNKYDQEINRLQQVEDRSEWRGSTLGVSMSGSY